MKSIKKQLFITISGVTAGFAIIILAIILSQLILQRNLIRKKGQREAKVLSEETGKTLGTLNEQIAKDFSGSCAKYFNTRFANIRKHVASIQSNMTQLYQEGKNYGAMDENVGLVKGVSKDKVSKEFGMVSPVRSFIKNLPEYDAKEISRLDLYVVTESGMCLDGTETSLGNHYADLRKENWYKKVKKTGKTYWSGIFKGKVTGKVKVICSMPVYDKEEKFCGCVSCDVAVDAFQEMIEEFNEKQITSVIFFDRADKLMYATNGYQGIGRVKKYLGKKEIVNLGEEIYSFVPLEETGWTICLVLNQETVNRTIQKLQADVTENAEDITDIVQESIQKIIIIFGISMAVGAFVVVIVTNFLAGAFVRPIRQLMSQVREAGSGNLNQVIEVRSKNEIGQLANAFSHMTNELKEYMEHLRDMTAEKERMTAELNVARQIQMNMLPNKFPAFPGRSDFDIYAVVNPSDGGRR